ncbi:caspase family protein [Methylovirgula sp. 4M-Z18]|uniref:caspase family protein n=1 Tax=Methylovirgula sp. 4M-Z18 TaxID=2293567 RepID=UPI001313F5F8|nr:caspase family protein [Methylovirgula sp. 4M-Z18]
MPAAALAAVMLALPAGAKAVERRVAFVVGNSHYKVMPQLNNPDNDAEAVAAALKREGFDVVTAVDLDHIEFDKALERFIRSLPGSEVSVLYYSGHGIQVGGDNRIIPIDASLKDPADLEVETISVKTIIGYMQQNSKAQLVYLDSCRNNPFQSRPFLIGPEKQTAVAGIGLAPITTKPSSLVAYSTQPGAVAEDGKGDKSPFTDSVLRYSFKLGVDAQKALDKVTDDVWEATNKRQHPWSESTLVQPIFLARPAIRIIPAMPVQTASNVSVKIGPAPKQGPDAIVPTEDAPVQIAASLGETLSTPRRVPIGVGQVALLGDFPLVRAATGAQIQIASAPSFGTMYLDGKPLAEGDIVDQNAIRNVTFEPSIGSEGKAQSVQLKVEQPGSGDSKVVVGKIETYVPPCDDLAGEPLDPQGVSAGKLPNEIDAKPAIAACTEAVAKFPEVARYKYELGRAKLANKDVAEAIGLFNAAANAGYIRAFYQLGYMAERGLGRAQNMVEANRLYRMGSDGGDAYAMLAYGYNLVVGRCETKSVDEGVKLLNRAVELGHPYAMNAVGSMYYHGDNLSADPKRGVRFYQAAMARNDINAMYNMGVAYLEGKGVARDPAMAMTLFKKASDGGHAKAPARIGAMYFEGIGVNKDVTTAMHWYEIGAERGDFDAAANLASIYANGPQDRRDLQKAAWYSSLAVALDSYGEHKDEAENLRALAVDAKTATVDKLRRELGVGAGFTTANIDDTLVRLAREAWQKRNPRLDLL